MRKTRTYLMAVSAFFIGAFLSSSVPAQETLFPAGYNITCEYSYEPPGFYQNGSIGVTWTVANNEDFDLSGLYYTDNLPAELNLDSYSLSIDNVRIQAYYGGPMENHLLEGYNTYRWIVDFPDSSGHVNNIVEPGQTLKLQYRITADNPGEYVFPFHTVCFYGNDTGFFSVADTVFIPAGPEEIPTLGEWGLLILGLLILAGATISTILKIRERAETYS